MKVYTTETLRNIALIGHGGAGKTSLAEAMVFSMGETNRLGKVNEGTTVSDYHQDEIDRKISISTSLLHGEWKEHKINILDTPGYSDFIGDVKCVLRVADMAVAVVNGVEGLEVGTDQALEFVDEAQVPRVFYVNRMDNEHADFAKVFEMARERYGTGVVAIQFPANSGEGFNKIVDVLRLKLFTFEPETGKVSVSDIPPELQAKAQEYRSQLIESAAESDDALLEQYFDKGELSENQLHTGLRKGILLRKVVPVLCGAASKNLGIHTLLDLIVEFGPTPKDFGKIKGEHPDTKQPVELPIDSKQPASVFVFKTLSEAHVGELSLVRVMNGTLAPGIELINPSKKGSEKIGQIFLMNGRTRKEIGQLEAGDIGALVKLKKTSTGDTLCDKRSPVQYAGITFPEALVDVAIKPKSRGDEEKISNGLHMLHDEDPSFRVVIDPELHQTIISGQGELHLTVIIKRLKERFGVDVVEERPKIPYRETINGKADEKYRHKKQTGGAGQFAEVWMRVESLPRGSGFEFENKVVGGHISGPFIPAIEKGIKSVLENGPLSGCKIVDVKAVVYDGKEHPVDSKDIAFQVAGREVFKMGFLAAKPILLEPIYDLEIKVPEECMGDVMGDLSSRRGKISGMESKGHYQVIKAKVPLADLDRYATTLRSLTSGRGIHSRKFSHYETVPKENEAKIIAEFKASKEEEKEK